MAGEQESRDSLTESDNGHPRRVSSLRNLFIVLGLLIAVAAAFVWTTLAASRPEPFTIEPGQREAAIDVCYTFAERASAGSQRHYLTRLAGQAEDVSPEMVDALRTAVRGFMEDDLELQRDGLGRIDEICDQLFQEQQRS